MLHEKVFVVNQLWALSTKYYISALLGVGVKPKSVMRLGGLGQE